MKGGEKVFRIGQEVTRGKDIGTFIGYDYLDGITYIGIGWAIRGMTGKTRYHTSWYTEEEIKKYNIVHRNEHDLENVG